MTVPAILETTYSTIMLLRSIQLFCSALLLCLTGLQLTMASDLLTGNGTTTLNTGNSSLSSSLNQPSRFLPVEQAFQLTSWVSENETSGQQQITLNWQIAPDYYLYRHRFIVKQLPDNTPTKLDIPDGLAKKDSYFGDVEVYYQQAVLTIPLEATATQGVYSISFQGCADAGLCYPPQTVFLQHNNQIATLSTSAPQTTTPQPSELLAEEQNDFTKLLASASLPTIIGLFFLAGLALTFTPCVLPMIPIISSIVIGQSENPGRFRAFSLSLTYVMAMAGTYALAGMLTGYFGAGLNLQLQLQSPLVIIVIAALFGAFALAMFGVYELRLPSSFQSKLQQISHSQRGGTYVGVALIGVISTLIVSPCVTAPLAGTLIFISSTGDPALGGVALLALGLGMGLPLLLIGTFGAQLLPKRGQWMNQIKVLFGILLLGLAIWMLDRVLADAVTVILWIMLCAGYAIYLGLFKLLRGQFKPLPMMSLPWALFSLLLIFNAVQGNYNPFKPWQAFAKPTAELHFIAADNLEQLDAILSAQPPGKIAMLDLYADWCVSCQVLEQEIFPSPGVNEQLQELTLIRADITRGTKEHQALLNHFGLFGPPSLLFFNQQQELRAKRIQGELSASELALHLKGLNAKTVKDSDNPTRPASAPSS